MSHVVILLICCTGWSPTLVGYCFQGGGKYGFYEVFKYLYGEKLMPGLNPTVMFLAASASAEFLADVALCPFEALKVRMQTSVPPFAKTLGEGWGKVTQSEGVAGYSFYLESELSAETNVVSIQIIQRTLSSLGATDSIHNGQICNI